MPNNILTDKDYQQPEIIIFIGPTRKETWVGTKKGLHDMYPKARIIKIK